MKQQTVKKLVALAASLAIAGCTAPGPLKLVDQTTPTAASAASKQGAGTIELNVLWPDFRAYGTQAIPNRATKVVVSLKHIDDSPVLDLNGQAILPVTAQRGTYGYMDTYGKFGWELAQQQGVEIKAELYAGDTVIATAKRVIDVVAGMRSTVALDLVLPDAPDITAVSTTSFRVGDTLVLTGANFGASQQWQARVFLQEEYTDGGDDPFGGDDRQSKSPPIYLPDAFVKVESDSKITVTIPERIRDGYREGNLTDFFWGYFNGQQSKLTLGVMVDGVNSKRVDVSMPKEVGAKATITLEQGFDAPEHRPDGQRYKLFDLTDATFSTPVASGTEWTFELAGNDYYYNRQRTTIRLTDSNGRAHIKQEWEYGSPFEQDGTFINNYGGPMPQLFWEFQFLRQIDAQGIEILREENVVLPAGVQLPAGVLPKAKHLAYSDSNGALYDLWVVPKVGPVKMRRLEVYGYKDQLWRNVREYRLIGFKPAGSTEN